MRRREKISSVQRANPAPSPLLRGNGHSELEPAVAVEAKTRSYYNCAKCPGYCCSIYERVQVNKRDLKRLARHFAVDVETAQQRFTTTWQGERILRRKADPIFGKACKFLDPVKRMCTIYDARPSTCREFPARERCAYYDLLQFERSQQSDDTVLPLVQITFRNGD